MQSDQEVISKIFSSSPDAIIISDLNNNILNCNQMTLNLFNYPSKNEILGKNFIELFTDKERSRIAADIITVMEKGLIRDEEYIFQKKNGEKFIGFISSSAIRADSAPEFYILSTIKDITKIKLAKQRLQVIFDAISDGISIIDKEHKILRVNAEILRLFNKKSFTALIGKSCFHEFFKKKQICYNCPVQRTFMNGEIHSATQILQKTEKENIILDISTFPIKNDGGNVIEVIEYIKDVTERIKLEGQLMTKEKMTATVELASGIAHEIRNPLANISASAQYCLSNKNKYNLPLDVTKYLKIILRNSDNAARVIKGLLNFARSQEVSYQLGDIRKIIYNVANLIKPRCLKQKVRLIIRLPRRLPNILFDEKRIAEAFSNITANSLEAMPNGGRLAITCYANFEKNELVIHFLDTGSGISREKLKKVLDPFFTTKKEGIGLGLYIALQIIKEHRGKINIKSEVGSGTELSVSLPILR